MQVVLTARGIESSFVHCVQLPFEDAVGVHLLEDKKLFVVRPRIGGERVIGRKWSFIQMALARSIRTRLSRLAAVEELRECMWRWGCFWNALI